MKNDEERFGNTVTFESGAKRERLENIFRFDLMSPVAARRLAATFAEGSEKYGDNNWRKGMPFSVLLNHVLCHLYSYMEGDRTEDHLSHADWGVQAMMEFEETQPELNDLYFPPDWAA